MSIASFLILPFQVTRHISLSIFMMAGMNTLAWRYPYGRNISSFSTPFALTKHTVRFALLLEFY